MKTKVMNFNRLVMTKIKTLMIQQIKIMSKKLSLKPNATQMFLRG
jgi:hypothetical protein